MYAAAMDNTIHGGFSMPIGYPQFIYSLYYDEMKRKYQKKEKNS